MNTGIADTTKRLRKDTQRANPPIGDPETEIPREAVEQRAYERFVERGGAHGADVDDWLEAERELLAGRSVAG